MALKDSIFQLLDDKDAEVTALQQKVMDLTNKVEALKTIPPVIINQARFGINIHLFSDPIYADTDRVIGLLKDMGIMYVRQDFDVYGTGKMIEHDKWVAIKPKFDAAGIHVRAMVYIRGVDGGITFTAFANQYPYFDEIEIGNENAILSGVTNSGLLLSDYDTVKLNNNIAYVTAAYKSLLPRPLKLITSITWIHYYYIDKLRSMGVNLWLSLHSYSDGFWNTATQKSTFGLNAWQSARAHYGAMVFEIGEANYMPKDLATYTDDLQLDRGSKLFNETYKKGIDVYWFELLDRVNSKGREGKFGIYRSDFSIKPLGEYIKKNLLYL